MEQTIEIWKVAVGFIGTIITLIVGFWKIIYGQRIKIERLDVQVSYFSDAQIKNEEKFETISNEVKELRSIIEREVKDINNKVTNILIILENKQNRP